MDHVEITGAGNRQLLYRSALRVPSFRECRVEDMQADSTVMFHWCFFSVCVFGSRGSGVAAGYGVSL